VRAFLATLASKGRVDHRVEGQRYLWFPVGETENEGSSAVARAMNTFFKGSRTKAIAALLGADDKPLDEAEYRHLLELIERARARKA
jgi:predicted transcriptional regulator